MAQPPRRIASAALAQQRGKLLSTSDGRKQFPALLQTCYGHKAVIGFDRYGLALGAVVPMEAVRLLAGFGDCVSAYDRQRIAEQAQALLREVPVEVEMCGMDDYHLEDGVIGADQVKSDRATRRISIDRPSPKKKRYVGS